MQGESKGKERAPEMVDPGDYTVVVGWLVRGSLVAVWRASWYIIKVLLVVGTCSRVLRAVYMYRKDHVLA